MAHVLKPRVAETSTTTGTGAFTLAGALSGHQRFSAVCSTSDTTEYVIVADDGTWEEGLGTYSSANTLTRTTVSNSTNAGAAVNFAAGNKTVLMTPLASRVGGIPRSTSMVKGDGSGALTAASAGTDFQAAITATGLLTGAGSGSVSAAVSGTDIKTINNTSLLGSGNIAVAGVASDVQTFNASGTWTKPSGATWVLVYAIGGGASGAAVNFNSTSNSVANGGSGGAFVGELFKASDLTGTVTVTVGAGGTAVSRTNSGGGTAGNAGGDTTFGSYLTGYGGTAGAYFTILGSPAVPPAGAGGSNAGYGVGGRNEPTLSNSTTYGGGGGGGASCQNSFSSPLSRSGGTSIYGGTGGNGAQNATGNATATAGSAPGGGGGGALTQLNAAYTATSGAGGSGQVIVYSW